MDLTPNQRPRISRTRLDCLDEHTILDRIEHKLSGDRALRVEQHLATCAKCRRLVSEALRSDTPEEIGRAATVTPDDIARDRTELRVDSDRTTDRHAQRSVLARGTTIDRYIVVDLLGHGGMGAVYRAFDPDLNRQVALKLVGLDAVEPEAREHARLRMLREAQALAKLQHPNVVAVYDVGRVGDDVFIAMELVDGWTLRAWLRETRRSAREILRVFERAGEGLAAAHAVGIIHRDFKPDNVMVGRDGRVRVVDFGLARVAGRARSRMSRPSFTAMLAHAVPKSDELTRAGAMLGTPAYMSPEQDAGLEAAAASDQFSFCVALYEALYGRLPFRGETYVELADSRADGAVLQPAALHGVTSRIRRAIVVGLRTEPADRHASMAALLEELERPRRRWQRWWIGGAAGALVLGVTGTLLFAGSSNDTVDPCATVGDEILRTWNPVRRAQVATKVGTSPNAQKLLGNVDAWIEGWSTERRAVCTAMITDQQPWKESKSAERLQCLQRRASDLDAKLAVVISLDQLNGQIIDNTLGLMPPAGECANAMGYGPDDVEKTRVMPIMKLIIEARQAQNAAKLDDAVATATSAVALARKMQTQGGLAAALQTLGDAQTVNGHIDAARDSYREAALMAAATHEDGMVADAWLALLQLSFRDHKLDETVDGALLAARVATARLDVDDRRRPMFDYTAGTLDVMRGRLADAADEIERAVAKWKDLGEERYSPELAAAANSLGMTYMGLGQWAKSKVNFERARVGMAKFGPDTPQLGTVLINLATLELMQEHYAAAEPLLEHGMAIYGKLRDNHPLLAEGEVNVGLYYVERAMCDRAKPHLAKARDVLAANPEKPPVLAMVMIGEARCTRDARTAVDILTRARAMAEHTTAIPTELPEIDFRTAEAIVRAKGDRARAIELATSARARFAALGAGTAQRQREIDKWLVAQSRAH